MKLTLTINYQLDDIKFEDEVKANCVSSGDIEKAFYTLHRKHKKIREILMKQVEEREGQK